MSTIGGVSNSGDSHQNVSKVIDPNRTLLASSEEIKANFNPSISMGIITMEDLNQHHVARGFFDPTVEKTTLLSKPFFA